MTLNSIQSMRLASEIEIFKPEYKWHSIYTNQWDWREQWKFTSRNINDILFKPIKEICQSNVYFPAGIYMTFYYIRSMSLAREFEIFKPEYKWRSIQTNQWERLEELLFSSRNINGILFKQINEIGESNENSPVGI